MLIRGNTIIIIILDCDVNKYYVGHSNTYNL